MGKINFVNACMCQNVPQYGTMCPSFTSVNLCHNCHNVPEEGWLPNQIWRNTLVRLPPLPDTQICIP